MDKKTLSIVSYITIIGWVIAFIIYNGKTEKSSLEKFHLEQSLGLGILGVLNYIASINEVIAHSIVGPISSPVKPVSILISCQIFAFTNETINASF